MLKLRYATEDWRELLLGMIDEAEREFGVCLSSEEYDGVAEGLLIDVLDGLTDRGVEYERAYQQSRGSYVIVQYARDEEELKVFTEVLEGCCESAREGGEESGSGCVG